MKTYPQAVDDMFSDRRTSGQICLLSPRQCRRAEDRARAGAEPWWLKVNYVSHHFDVIEGGRSRDKNTPSQ